MFDVTKKHFQWGKAECVLESGVMARQADGAVFARYGETCVLATVVAEKHAKDNVDFLPLSVNYMERSYAAGKIPGGFFKREGRPTEREILISRLIDRPIRPLFPSNYRFETQLLCTTISHDQVHDTDVLAINAASSALALAGLVYDNQIVAAAKVGFIDKTFVLNPTLQDMQNSRLELVVAGTRDGVLMVESEADQLSEDIMLDAVLFGHEQMLPVIAAIEEMCQKAAKPTRHIEPEPENMHAWRKRLEADNATAIKEAYQEKDKQKRIQMLDDIRAQAIERLASEYPELQDDPKAMTSAQALLKELEKKEVRSALLTSGTRIDGRKKDDIRAIDCRVGILPRTHGSALFTRGETQALAVTTLGSSSDEQIIDAIVGDQRESFLLHYNFPPYSVGETGRVGFTGRREIGHGKLAWRALRPMMPTKETFPYTVRIVSEITESNGSSSMATVCGACLALMDAGVPLKAPVAGIAMGLIKDADQFIVLSDIIGDEDHLGDMDFKVAGSAEGITSLQMDIKITSINAAIMKEALAQAQAGRLHILTHMKQALPENRVSLSQHAPKIQTLSVPVDKIRDIIGTGGKVIREISHVSGAKIDIDDDGIVKISAVGSSSMDKALAMIKDIIAEPEIGKIYQGKVVKCVEFGAFVNFMSGRDGLVHISELAEERVRRVTDIVNEGDQVNVKVLDIDERGRVRLTMRRINE